MYVFIENMTRLTHIFILLGLLFAFKASAQETVDSAYMAQLDSLLTIAEEEKKQEEAKKVIEDYENLMLKKEMSFGTSGIAPMFRGGMLMWTDHNFYKQPAKFETTKSSYRWTDYAIGSLPILANWTLKAAGVKSRSKLERMLTANALAFSMSFGLTELLKTQVNETRPDRTDNKSFSSCHAAFAFTSASILSREYGHLSPWVTIGSYTTASATQMLRIKHNKHWTSDIFMGAGIGLTSTNLAYFLTDKILGKDAINKPKVTMSDMQRMVKFNTMPSGFTFLTGTEIGDRSIEMEDGIRIKTGAAFTAGFDIDCYTSDVFAIEFMARTTEAQMKVFGSPNLFTGDNLSIYHADLAAKYCYPINPGMRLGFKLLAGSRINNGINLTDGTKTYSLKGGGRFEFGSGMSVEYIQTENYIMGFNFDYYHTCNTFMKNRYSISSVYKVLF